MKIYDSLDQTQIITVQLSILVILVILIVLDI